VNSDPTLREDGNAADRVGHGWYCARPLIPHLVWLGKALIQKAAIFAPVNCQRELPCMQIDSVNFGSLVGVCSAVHC
jgi:hypothetical protein